MSGPADRMLGLMYEWMDKAKKCSSDLRDLAKELESIREKYNAVETVGNTAGAVWGLMGLIGAPFTGGASLALAGVGIATGATVSIGSKIIEEIHSSVKLERVENIDRRCQRIAEEIQELYQQLRSQYRFHGAEERDKHILIEFLRAMAIRSNLNIPGLKERLINIFFDDKSFGLTIEVHSVYATFSLKPDGVQLFAGIEAAMSTVIRVQALCAVVGVAISLVKAIEGWEQLIKNNNETKASRSLKDAARQIENAVEQLKRHLNEIERMTRDRVNSLRWG